MSKKTKRPFNDDLKHQISTIVMRTFVYDDVGFQHANPVVIDQTAVQITTGQYNVFMITGVKKALRRIQDFLYRHGNAQLRPLDKDEQMVIRTPMIQCRKWMSEEHISTFMKFIRVEHLGEQIDISLKQAQDLYTELATIARNAQHKKQILTVKREEKQRKKLQKQLEETARKIKRENKKPQVKKQSKCSQTKHQVQ